MALFSYGFICCWLAVTRPLSYSDRIGRSSVGVLVRGAISILISLIYDVNRSSRFLLLYAS